MIEVYRSGNGWRFRIKGKNGEIIAWGEEYKTKYNAYRAIGQLEAILLNTISDDDIHEIDTPEPDRMAGPGDIIREADVKRRCICQIKGIADLTCPVHGINGSNPWGDGQL